MHEAVVVWIETGFPHPSRLGAFFRALLSNDLMGAFAHADAQNTAWMRSWTLFLYNFAPAPCHGSLEKIMAWHHRFFPNRQLTELTFTGEPGGVVSSVRVETDASSHARLTVWNRGGCAGDSTADYSGQLRLRLPRSLHAHLSKLAAVEEVSLNNLLLALISVGLGRRQLTGEGRER